MAQPGWAPKKKKGEDEGAYKKRYYSAQRENAEETGDQKTTDKIYGKLGKKSHSVDADAVNKKALLYGPALAAGGGVGVARALAGRAATAAASGGAMKALSSGAKGAAKVATPVAKAASGGVRKLQGSVPRLASTAGQKALSGGGRAPQALGPGQRALPKGEAKSSVREISSRKTTPKSNSVKAGSKPHRGEFNREPVIRGGTKESNGAYKAKPRSVKKSGKK